MLNHTLQLKGSLHDERTEQVLCFVFVYSFVAADRKEVGSATNSLDLLANITVTLIRRERP